MSFSDFKSIAEVQRKYGIRYEEKDFLKPKQVALPDSFIEDLKFCMETMDVFSSEASRSEIIISPLLREAYKRHHAQYALWIQKNLAVDENLSGTPDYLIASRSHLGKTVLGKPIVVVVEAKRNDFEQGWGQCLAELVAAQKLNGNPNRPVYGVVTDANLWQFGRLTETIFCKDPLNFTIDGLDTLYGALDGLLELAGRDESPSHQPNMTEEQP